MNGWLHCPMCGYLVDVTIELRSVVTADAGYLTFAFNSDPITVEHACPDNEDGEEGA